MQTSFNSWQLFLLTLKHELLLGYRSLIEIFNPLLFFMMVITLFPLAISPDLVVLKLLAPGILWIAALLAILLAIDRLFRVDLQEGSLEQLILSPQPLVVIVFAKLVAQWVMSGLPVILLAPLLGWFLHLSWHTLIILIDGLLLGTPTLIFLGAIGRALTLQSRNSGLLTIILILPFYVPILIFGAGSVMVADEGFSVAAQFSWLGVLLLLALPLSPWATAGALKIGVVQ